MLLRGVLVGFVLAVVAAPIASALPKNVHVVARWSVTEKGSLDHTWSLPSSEPCEPSGDGHVKVRFSSPLPGHIIIADNGYGLGDFGWNGNLKVHGTITAVDARVRNPPKDPRDPCDNDPHSPVPDKRGCRTATLTDLMELEMIGPRLTKYGIGGANETNSLNPPANVEDCETGGLEGFSRIESSSRNSAHQELPILYPSAATLAKRHGTFSVSAHDTQKFNPHSTTVRHITLTFHRTA